MKAARTRLTKETLQSFHEDREAQCQQEHAVHECSKDFRAVPAI